MSYGIRVQNSSGFVQIDDIYDNFVLHQTGTVSASTNSPATISYANTGSLPLIAIRTVSGGSMAVAEITTTSAVFRGGYDGAATVEYRVYRRLAGVPASSGNYGLRVYNGAQALTYDSGRAYMRIRQLATFTASWVASGPFFTLNHSFGHAFAIVNDPRVFIGVYLTNGPNWWVLPAIKTGTNSISVTESWVPTGIPPNGSPYEQFFNLKKTIGVVLP